MRRTLGLALSAVVGVGVLVILIQNPFQTDVSHAENPLIVDGDFENNPSGKELRTEEDPRGWYESRRDSKEARLQLKLSTKPIGGNETQKAMIKGDPKLNTYLSQELERPQEKPFSLRWDVYVKEIGPEANRSCFQMLGNDTAKGKGPNAAGAERFVFLGFENAATKGKMNLFAFEGGKDKDWSTKKVLVPNLDLGTWYTIAVAVDPPGKRYTVSVDGVTTKPADVRAFQTKNGDVPKKLTHVSFASWNDGPGTFYVDNVRVP
ncbi:MAG: hypothetical protein KDA27_24455 [Candidatus Eisenbacteria bacterium]|uniref:Uncharacterized protein n=1 Tax=Eiseniibacteriota bacterium TaxID=2212470 RepID=A0A956NKS7_UNCEI|nr:hypothetical protein [Candidatus Eisenbacteria bacterium]